LHLAHLPSCFARVANAHVHAFNARQLEEITGLERKTAKGEAGQGVEVVNLIIDNFFCVSKTRL
jgi:hypothetical protein